MNIVVWKSPKALRGILRKMFGMDRKKPERKKKA